MQVMTIESVILPTKPLVIGDESTGTTPPAMLMNLFISFSGSVQFWIFVLPSVQWPMAWPLIYRGQRMWKYERCLLQVEESATTFFFLFKFCHYMC